MKQNPYLAGALLGIIAVLLFVFINFIVATIALIVLIIYFNKKKWI